MTCWYGSPNPSPPQLDSSKWRLQNSSSSEQIAKYYVFQKTKNNKPVCFFLFPNNLIVEVELSVLQFKHAYMYILLKLWKTKKNAKRLFQSWENLIKFVISKKKTRPRLIYELMKPVFLVKRLKENLINSVLFCKKKTIWICQCLYGKRFKS